MNAPSAVVLGGGLAGVGAAWALAEAGFRPVTLAEAHDSIGGLAGSFERDGRWYPLGYHHVLDRDVTLRFVLRRLGLLERVRWRRIRMLFDLDGRLFDLRRPLDLLRLPLALRAKARFALFLRRCAAQADWSEWVGRDAQELLDGGVGPEVREHLFEPLTRIKFELPCRETSAAWLGARLHHREGSAPLGCVPGADWTRLLCEGLAAKLGASGVAVRTRAPVAALESAGGRILAARLAGGARLEADAFVSALPTDVYCRLAPEDRTPGVASIRYTALLSVICARPAGDLPDFYWLNCLTPGRAASGLFRLDSLNPTLGAPGETCLDFVTHLASRARPLFALEDDALLERYAADFRALFARELAPRWVKVNRLATYSPVFDREFRNPPVGSATWRNVWFAGNYRTFPSVASTGTALRSGFEAAAAAAAAHGRRAALAEEAATSAARAAHG